MEPATPVNPKQKLQQADGCQAAESWELSKENYVPVRTGRKKAVLAELTDPSDSHTKQALELKRRELWRAVQEYQGDDPLDPWLKIIKWTLEHSTGGKTELQSLLESCTSELLKVPRYKSDQRYLRLWIQYADCLPDPNDVFLFLREQQIGLEFALYYEAYATFHELRGNCSAADAVYQDGIKRNARPLERLKQKLSAFQNRMAQRIQRRIQEEALVGGPAPEEPARASLAPLVPVRPGAGAAGGAGRGLLGAAATPHAASASTPALLGVNRGPGVFPGFTPGSQARGHPQQPQPQPSLLQRGHLFTANPGSAGGSANVPAAPAPSLPVAMDAEFQGPGAPQPLPGYSLMPQGLANPRELQPYNVVRKENTAKPGQWAGTTLAPPTAPATTPIAPPRLDICIDDEFDEEPPNIAAQQQQQQQQQQSHQLMWQQQQQQQQQQHGQGTGGGGMGLMPKLGAAGSLATAGGGSVPTPAHHAAQQGGVGGGGSLLQRVLQGGTAGSGSSGAAVAGAGGAGGMGSVGGGGGAASHAGGPQVPVALGAVPPSSSHPPLPQPFATPIRAPLSTQPPPRPGGMSAFGGLLGHPSPFRGALFATPVAQQQGGGGGGGGTAVPAHRTALGALVEDNGGGSGGGGGGVGFGAVQRRLLQATPPVRQKAAGGSVPAPPGNDNSSSIAGEAGGGGVMQTPGCAQATPVHAQPSHQQHQPHQQLQVGGAGTEAGAPQSSMKLVGKGAADACAPTPAPPPHPPSKPTLTGAGGAGGGDDGAETVRGVWGVRIEEGDEEVSFEERRAAVWQRRHGSLLPHVQQLRQEQQQRQQQRASEEGGWQKEQQQERLLEEQRQREQALKEQQAKEQALKEQQAKEQALKEQQAKEQALKEQRAKEQALKEQQAKEQALKEQRAKEQALKEQQAKEQALREQQAKEQALREQQAKEQALKEQQAREQALKEQQAKQQQELVTLGLGGKRAGSAQGSSTVLSEPTVTINTRAAFDAMNDMFGDEAGARVQAEIRGACKEGGGGQALVQAALSALPASALTRAPSLSAPLGLSTTSTAAAVPGGSAASVGAIPGGGGGQTSGRGSALDVCGGGLKRTAPEPTVTINTRAAFDAMNDMFGDGGGGGGAAAVYNLQQQDDTMARLPSLTLASKPISAMDVCRLANSRTSAARSAGGRPSLLPPQQQQQPHLRDDTTTDLWGARSASGGQEDALRPDTEYLTRGLSASLAGGSRAAGQRSSRRSSIGLPGLGHAGVSNLYGGLSAGGGGGGGMGMYEDTVCMGLGPLSAAAAAPAAGGAGLRERQPPPQQLLTEGGGGQAPVHQHQQLQQQVAPAMGLYEDTEFFSGGELGGHPASVPTHRAPLAPQPQQHLPPQQVLMGASSANAASPAKAAATAQLLGKEPAKGLQQRSFLAAGASYGDKENAAQL